MPVIIKNDELEMLNKSGISESDIQRTVNAYRTEGISDDAIRLKLDGKLSSIRQAPIVEEKAKDLRPERNMWDDISETLINSPIAKGLALGSRNILNSPVNPVGQIAKLTNVAGGGNYELPESLQLEGTEAKNATERAIEQSMGLAHDSYGLARIGNVLKAKGLLGSGSSKISKISQALLTGNEGVATASGFGAGTLLGAMDPKSTAGQVAATMVGGIAGGGVKSAIGSVGKSIINPLYVNSAKKSVIKQMEKGAFNDVNFGFLAPKKVKELNAIRDIEKVAHLENGNLIIPKNVMQHLHERRVLGNKMTPNEVADMVVNAFHGKENIIGKGSFPHIQSIIDVQNNPANVGYISMNPANKKTVVKTAFKEDVGRAVKRTEPERRGARHLSSSQVISENDKAAGARLSALQSGNDSIAGYSASVNKNFVNALADKDKTRVLKNAAMAGNDDVLQEARILTDRLARLKGEAPDHALADALRTPQMKASKSEYELFMKNNGDLPIDANIAHKFYVENPTAKPLLDSAKRDNPQGFKNIQNGSLAEFEELKRLLKSAAKRQGEEAPKAEGYKTARQQLKDIIEGYVPGFRNMSMRYADSKMTQQMYEDAIKNGASAVGGTTKSPFIDQFVSVLGGSGAVGGLLASNTTAITAGTLALIGRGLIRAARRNAGQSIMNGNNLNADILRGTLNGANNAFQNSKYPLSALFLRNNTNKDESKKELLQKMLMGYGQ